MTALFTVTLEFSDGGAQDIPYETIIGCIRDPKLKTLFGGGLVAGCSVHCGGRRLTARPITTLESLLKQVVSNSTTILTPALQEAVGQ